MANSKINSRTIRVTTTIITALTFNACRPTPAIEASGPDSVQSAERRPYDGANSQGANTESYSGMPSVSSYQTPAGKTLDKLVHFVDRVRQLEDVSVTKINDSLGLDLKPIKNSKGFWGNGREIAKGWSYGAVLKMGAQGQGIGKIVDFDFSPILSSYSSSSSGSNSNAPRSSDSEQSAAVHLGESLRQRISMSPICEMDADEFSQKLQNIGFSKPKESREGNTWFRDQIRDVGKMHVITYLEPQNPDSNIGAGKPCVRRAQIFVAG